jgi:HK97 family phage portal protein
VGLLGRLSRSREVAVARAETPASLTPVDNVGGRGLWTMLLDVAGSAAETFTGYFQRDIPIRRDVVFAQTTVFACATRIASDLSKLDLELVALQEKRGRRVWTPTESGAFSPVLRQPNAYQTRQQFIESWQLSKQLNGNTYALKERDGSNIVRRLHVLDPQRVSVLVAQDGSVFYQLREDALAGIGSEPDEMLAVPASEIIHDRFNTLFHPLCGLSPIYACGLSAMQAHAIQTGSTKFFENLSRPGGILTAPGRINEETAKRIKAHWESEYKGANAGRVAVLGDDLKYMSLSVNPDNAQLVEQLALTAQQVCTAFHVPGYMVGVGELPTLSNMQALLVFYYARCLQGLIEATEACFDLGLGLRAGDNKGLRTRMNLQDLLRMDEKTLAEVESIKVQRGISAPNDARERFDMEPAEGGDDPMIQQQNFSLPALAKRDAGPNPFGSAAPKPPPADASSDAGSDGEAPPAETEAAAEPSDTAKALRALLSLEAGRREREALQQADVAIARARRAEAELEEQRAAAAQAEEFGALAAAIAAQLAGDDDGP